MDRVNLLRRRITGALLASPLATTAALPSNAAAQGVYPERPITWVVPYAPGAATDVLTRHLAESLGTALGRAIVVENVPGGGSTIGAARFARERPDGYRLITLDVAGLAINPAAMARPGYDPVTSFTPITMGWRIPFVLVTASERGPRSLADLIAQAKERPEALTYASAGIGSAIHMAMLLLEDIAGIRLTHVPYKGAAPALTDVLAGRVDAMFISLGASAAHLQAGTLRALGASGTRRFASAPDLPTIAEQGLAGYEASSWQGVLAPAGLPEDLRDRLNRELNVVLKSESIGQKFRASGAVPEPGTPAAFADYIRTESTKWAQLIRSKGIRLDP